MDLADLTTRYRAVYTDFTSWETLATQLQADPHDNDTLMLLVAELREHGRFRQPVLLGVYEEWEYGEAEDDEDVLAASYLAVLDGTHRVCAHMLAGISAVAVEYDGEEEPRFVGDFTGDEADPTYGLIMNTTIEVPLPLANVAPTAVVAREDFDEREADLDLWESLMSLRIDDNVWITSPTSGSSREVDVLHYSITWDAQAFRVLPEVISTAVRAKLNRFGYAADRFTIRTVLESMLGDKPVEVDAVTALAHLRADN